ncbi:hypothetical protein J1614_006400 [Plenodomus biglobosus]|nr:hypothetical protein J1614_006400 [Plenodomus biglobosus]
MPVSADSTLSSKQAHGRKKHEFARHSPLYVAGKYSCPEHDGWENTSWYRDYLYVLARLKIRDIFSAAVSDESSAFQEALQMAREYSIPGASWPRCINVQVGQSPFYAHIWAQAAQDTPKIGIDETITSIYKARILEVDSGIILLCQTTGKFLTFMPIVSDDWHASLEYVVKLRQEVPPENLGQHRQKHLH